MAVPSITCWLDAQRISSLYTTDVGSTNAVNSGDAVGRWEDLSGQGKHATQATSTKRGTYNPTGCGGKPGVTFDGVDDVLSTANVSMFNGAIYMVVKRLSSVSNTYMGFAKIGASPTGVAADGVMISRNGADDKWGVSTPQTGPAWYRFRKGAGTIAVNDFLLLSWRWGPSFTDVMIRKNLSDFPTVDVESFTGYTTRVASANPIHLAAGYSTHFANCSIGEMIAYSALPTTAQINQIEAYLKAKWGTP